MAEEFQGSLPTELQQYADFAGNISFLVIGLLLRRLGFIRDEHIPGMQIFTFTLCLPILLLGVVWTATIRQEAISLLGFSCLTNILEIILAVAATWKSSPKNRGFYLMITTGSALAYVYPMILRSDKFGTAFIPYVIMWELGGNIEVATIFHALAAQIYAPVDSETGLFDQEPASPCGPVSKISSSTGLVDASPQIRQDLAGETPQTVGARERYPSISIDVPPDLPEKRDRLPSAAVALPVDLPETPSTAVSTPSKPSEAASQGLGRSLLRTLASTPIIWALLVGLTLNLLKIPMYSLPGKGIRGLSSAFAPLLYVLLGASLRFNLDRSAYGLVFRSLASRWTANAIFVLFVRFVLPLESGSRAVVTLCIVAPVTNTFVMYSGQHGYRLEIVAMVKNLSDVVSLLVMSILLVFVL